MSLKEILFLSLFLISLSQAHILLNQDHDYYFENGTLKASTIGEVTNLLSQLLNTAEITQSFTGETVESLAKKYYGTASFAPLIIRANNHLTWESATAPIPSTADIRLPSPLLCTQFVGIDCILESYNKSCGCSPAVPNFWRDLRPELRSQVDFYMKYPTYIYFVMTLLQDELVNPATSLTIVLKNELNMKLFNGKISFTTGFGNAITPEVASNEQSTYRASRSDLLQGIHGTFTYDYISIRGQLPRPFSFDFHAYAGNGTFRNSMYVSGQPTQFVYTTTEDGVREFSLGDGMTARISITTSPNAIMTIILSQSSNPTSLLTDGLKKIVPNQKKTVALQASWAAERGYYHLGFVPKNQSILQGWRLVPLQSSTDTGNRFLIVNANSSLALEQNLASGNVTLQPADKSNENQIWQIQLSITANAYFIKGQKDMCMLMQTNTYLSYTNNADNHHFLWLEPCINIPSTSHNQIIFQFEPLNQPNYANS